MHCVAYSEEARDEAAEGGAEKEGAGASNFRVVGREGMLWVRLIWFRSEDKSARCQVVRKLR